MKKVETELKCTAIFNLFTCISFSNTESFPNILSAKHEYEKTDK